MHRISFPAARRLTADLVDRMQAVADGLRRQPAYGPPEVRAGDSIVQADDDPGIPWRDYVPPPLARATDPITSHQAAAQAVSLASSHHALILTAVTLYGAQTAHEIAPRIDLSAHQVLKRCGELERAGKLARTKTGGYVDGRPLYWCRKTPSGRLACVWKLATT